MATSHTSPAILADQLFHEVECLVEVGVSDIFHEYGLRTLTDLYYLVSAVGAGGFIDAWPESNIVELVSKLPSAHTWIKYISIYDEGGNLAHECEMATLNMAVAMQ